jgi:hypothetical protein
MHGNDHEDLEIKAGWFPGGQRALGQEWIWSIHNFLSSDLLLFFEVYSLCNLLRGFSSKNPEAKLKFIAFYSNIL